MPTVKESIIKEIQKIDNEDLLISFQDMLRNMQDVSGYITTTPEQKSAVAEAREEYKTGKYLSTDQVFDSSADD
jgi:hypothetical protein